jgi:RNA polymerase sigma-70 factor, ECF subfamily
MDPGRGRIRQSSVPAWIACCLAGWSVGLEYGANSAGLAFVSKSAPDVGELLDLIAKGDKEAVQTLIPLVYDELHRIASRLMRRESANHTLQPTALVNEAYMRLVQPRDGAWKDRAHFCAVAAIVMRQILVDHARARKADKRGGAAPLPLELFDPAVNLQDPDRILAIDAALSRLEKLDPRQCRIVELRVFAGMTVEETAEALTISSRTVKREWQFARTWLYGELKS